MKSSPLVSIALCTYNGEKYLIEQLESLISQTYKNIEIIVVDDCSRDNTFNLLKKYESAGKISLYQNEKNLGFARNFEKAISLCNGDFIALSDQDDIWDSKKIEVLLKNIGECILIYHDSELIDSSGTSLRKKTSDFANFTKGENNKAFIFCNCISGHATLFKKDLIKYVLPIPENFYHDWWMAYVASTINKITFTKEILVKYRQHELTNTDILKLRENVETNLKRSSKIANPKQREEGTKKTIAWLKVFQECKFNKKEDLLFLKKLINLYKKRQKQFLCPSLFITLLTNIGNLYCIDNRPLTGKIKYIVKESIGDRLKNSFHHFKNKIKR